MVFEGKKIVLGVTGGIAAYKAVEIASRLRKKGAKIHVNRKIGRASCRERV